MFKKVAEKVEKQTKGKYPAPPAIIECVQTGLQSGHADGSRKEAELFGKLSQSRESASLRVRGMPSHEIDECVASVPHGAYFQWWPRSSVCRALHLLRPPPSRR